MTAPQTTAPQTHHDRVDLIAEALDLPKPHVVGALALLDEGNTVPFIARYRKERTYGLDEVQLRLIAQTSERLEKLQHRRAAILAALKEQGVLDEALHGQILGAQTTTRLEDLYAPFKAKRKTRAGKARDAGLDAVAHALRVDQNPVQAAHAHTSDAFPTVEDVLKGAKDILAQIMADDAEVREHARSVVARYGLLESKKRRGADADPTYDMYLNFKAPLNRVRPHQVLAMRRGDRDKALSYGVTLEHRDRLMNWIKRCHNPAHQPKNRALVDEAIEDGYKRLLFPSIERDVRGVFEERADAHAIEVFALNLKNLLMQPPMTQKCVMGIDPGFRTGCKIAIVDAQGMLIDTAHIHVHDGRAHKAADVLQRLWSTHKVDLVAIGNGTGGRETEEVVALALRDDAQGVRYTIVDEAGASVYSASDVAREEFPDLDVSVRGAVSIARRLQDPLAELVKIDPKSIGVGMYQHDVDQGALTRALDAVVEDVVNSVGVDVNTASASLLAYVAGIGPATAKRIVAHREQHGALSGRKDLLKIKGLGQKAFEQCAGFLRIRGGQDMLDNTSIHPESYPLARSILNAVDGASPGPDLLNDLNALRVQGVAQRIAKDFGVGALTLEDIMEALIQPGRDPRADLDAPQLRADVLSMDDLEPGMILTGTVRNVIDFGAFVDIGVKQDGLVHVSELADTFVRNPHEVVRVGDQVDVRVLEIDHKRKRIALSMKQA